YFFPLPEKSAVDKLWMQIGDRIIEGEIKTKQKARQIYQQAKISGKKASLVEQHRPNIFSNKVANIAPFETIVVTIEYQQDLTYQKQDGFSIKFPMTMTRRYTPSVQLVQDYHQFKNGFQFQPSAIQLFDVPQKAAIEKGGSVSISVNMNSGLPLEFIKSKSHKINYLQKSNNQYHLTLNDTAAKTDRDFILNWKPLAGAEPQAALFTESFNGEEYLSLMVLPPTDDNASVNSISREVIFVLDTSGSMAGESILQAKQSLLSGLDLLTENDFFNVIEFNHQTTNLFSNSMVANNANKLRATNFVNRLSADGGTEMLRAMHAALANQSSLAQVRQVIFLTDGAISNEAELFDVIESKLQNSRLFPVGIGSAPNEFFMRKAALFGRGKAIFVNDISKSKLQIEKLFIQISQPQMSDIKVNWTDSMGVEMWPQKIPDLFAGQPLWLKAKISNSTSFQAFPVKLTGRLSNSLWQSNLNLSSAQQQPGIAKLWAREKIASIMNDSRHGRLDQNQEYEVTQTALKYQLVSRFTSLIAVDKTPARVTAELHQKRIAQVAPKGHWRPKNDSSLYNKGSSTLQYPATAISMLIGPKYSYWLLALAFVLLLVSRFRTKFNSLEF
ncbi:MAG: marine proteobacterial sortase target protein, partial [Kangiellaceae bacterium]|nr:marine proteobacterial sortase target protein [Kangiellaceae bacterium]